MAARSSQRCASCLTRPHTLIFLLSTVRPALRSPSKFLQSAGASASLALRPRYLSNSIGNPPPISSTSDAPKSQERREVEGHEEAPAATSHEPLAGSGPAEEAAPQLEEVSSSSSTPWYLEVEPPRHPTLVPHQAALPPVPDGCPPLTEQILIHANEDLGLDDISLLDLRSLDPPPALGPNLLMIFGTARSQRHLHVSADRLVRWLRARGVTASADGLLGRNELKHKLRRRARRAKLVGDNTFDKDDDGLSTGWVCVNLGTLGWKEMPSSEITTVDDQGRTSGFGQPITGTTIVVQMFTEARREELGLERLWTGVLNKSNREKEAVKAGQAEDPLQALVGTKPPRKRRGGTFADFNPAQARQYSTTARPADDSMSLEALFSSDRAGFFEELSYVPERKRELMDKIKAFMDEKPIKSAATMKQLLALVDLVTSSLPRADTWFFRAFVTSKALTAARYYRGDALSDLRQLFSELKMAGIPLARRDALHLLNLIFASTERKSRPEEPVELHRRAELAADLLQTMHERGEPVLANDVIAAMQRGLAGPVAREDAALRTASAKIEPQPARSGDSAATPTSARTLRDSLEDVRAVSGLSCPSEEELMALMEARSAAGDFEGFWDAWRLPAREGRPRSPGLYWWLFRHAAQLGRPDVAMEALRTAIPQALSERPEPVQLRGTMARAVRDCVLVVEPRALEQMAAADSEHRHKSKAEVLRILAMLEP